MCSVLEVNGRVPRILFLALAFLIFAVSDAAAVPGLAGNISYLPQTVVNPQQQNSFGATYGSFLQSGNSWYISYGGEPGLPSRSLRRGPEWLVNPAAYPGDVVRMTFSKNRGRSWSPPVIIASGDTDSITCQNGYYYMYMEWTDYSRWSGSAPPPNAIYLARAKAITGPYYYYQGNSYDEKTGQETSLWSRTAAAAHGRANLHEIKNARPVITMYDPQSNSWGAGTPKALVHDGRFYVYYYDSSNPDHIQLRISAANDPTFSMPGALSENVVSPYPYENNPGYLDSSGSGVWAVGEVKYDMAGNQFVSIYNYSEKDQDPSSSAHQELRLRVSSDGVVWSRAHTLAEAPDDFMGKRVRELTGASDSTRILSNIDGTIDTTSQNDLYFYTSIGYPLPYYVEWYYGGLAIHAFHTQWGSGQATASVAGDWQQTDFPVWADSPDPPVFFYHPFFGKIWSYDGNVFFSGEADKMYYIYGQYGTSGPFWGACSTCESSKYGGYLTWIVTDFGAPAAQELLQINDVNLSANRLPAICGTSWWVEGSGNPGEYVESCKP